MKIKSSPRNKESVATADCLVWSTGLSGGTLDCPVPHVGLSGALGKISSTTSSKWHYGEKTT
jgi:hypothetical protein